MKITNEKKKHIGMEVEAEFVQWLDREAHANHRNRSGEMMALMTEARVAREADRPAKRPRLVKP